MKLFDTLPELSDGNVFIGSVTEENLPALREITDGNMMLSAAESHGRDFETKKGVIAGIYLADTPVGVAEISDYREETGSATVYCVIGERFRHRGIATRALALMQRYLLLQCGLFSLTAYVKPENTDAVRVLLRCGFVRQGRDGREDVYTCDIGGAYGTVGCV